MTIVLTAIIFISCNRLPKDIETETKTLVHVKQGERKINGISIIKNISDSSIINTTNRTIDVLFNGIDNYLGGRQNPEMRVSTECIVCEPFQVYKQGILFGKRLYVTKDSVIIFHNERDIPDTTDIIRMKNHYGERKLKKYQFSNGILSMNYQGQSCNDADFVLVNLLFDNGSITINKFINASFFEYDLDHNGTKEQYLLGVRNCSQELALIRVNDDGE